MEGETHWQKGELPSFYKGIVDPPNQHMPIGAGGILQLSSRPFIHSARSSAEPLFCSAAASILQHHFSISKTDIGLLIGVTKGVAVFSTLSFGSIVERMKRQHFVSWQRRNKKQAA